MTVGEDAAQVPCSECRELSLREALVDCSAFAPLAGLCCEECAGQLVDPVTP